MLWQGEGDARGGRRQLLLLLLLVLSSLNDVDLVARLRRLQQRNCLVRIRVKVRRDGGGGGMGGTATVLAAGALLMLCIGQIVNWRGILHRRENRSLNLGIAETCTLSLSSPTQRGASLFHSLFSLFFILFFLFKFNQSFLRYGSICSYYSYKKTL